MDNIKKYFPDLSEEQLNKLNQFSGLFKEWNQKINLISRKDIDNLEINHILHSLAIGKFIKFQPGTNIMDLGSGGGLPGIPLAILFPDSNFLLIDRIGKKMNAVNDMISRLDLKNITALQADSSEIKDKFQFVVNRAVMPQEDIIKAVRKNISPDNFNSIPNGIISLKGGDLSAEVKNIKKRSEIVPISTYFKEPFFETKKILYTYV